MYLAYIDGSGSVKNPNEKYFILGGVSVFERQIFHLIKRIDAFIESLNLGPPEEIELHASVMANGREKPWKGVPRKVRLQIIENALEIVQESHWSVSLFAIAVHKAQRAPNDPVEYAFEEICNRFNLQLQRIYYRAQKRKKESIVALSSWISRAMRMHFKALPVYFAFRGRGGGISAIWRKSRYSSIRKLRGLSNLPILSLGLFGVDTSIRIPDTLTK